eukprot:Blabericola_migrator_1__2527@NODE_1711_length_3946_cov_99_832173_g1106_i0_p1_GENE_NODE_1711_length_3946_cov_99_832173_g1106_i0NODE_1711_length_3946_cov_99_832173_g1106_i0_p1_ORF_typecomplete_len1124_score215_81_NODE_1711_length_3946_cov_99_832173_g1106_i02813652
MPSYNLTVAPSSTVGSRTVFMGLLCTLPTQGLSFTDNESVAAVCSQTTSSKKRTTKRPPRITDIAALDQILKKEPGTVSVMKQTSKEALFRVRDMAIQSDPAIAEGIKMLEAQGIKYVIEIRKKSDSMKGSEDGAMDIWDATGVNSKTSLYRQALKNQVNLGNVEAVNVDQAAAVKKLLTTVGNLTRVAPDSPAKNQAAQFRYFLEEVSEVVSDLKETNAPKALLPGAVGAVFAKYKDQCWDGLMKLAGDEAAKELQACADVLLDDKHINNYLKFVEAAQLAPPGPSCEEFDVAFGLLSEVDTETTSLYRDIIVYLHDIVKPQVDSLDKLRNSQVNGGMKDEAIQSQINQINICIRNYMQCFYNIAQDFAQIERMSVPDKKARLQASMYSRIAGVSRKFWPALEGCLEKLCDSTIVEDIRSKEGNLRKHLVAKSLHAGQLNSDEESAIVKDTSPESLWSRMISYMTNLLSSNDGVKESDMTDKHDQEIMSPMFSDFLEIVEQLKTYGQIASSSPEESPDVPDTIAPGDHVAICGALGFVSKPKAAALFSYLKKLQKLLDLVDYETFADEEELASIKKFLNVDYHIMKAIQDEGHPLGVHGDIDAEACDKIMTSTLNRYFGECWPHISAVLEGGDQEESIKGFEGMATDILNWRDSEHGLGPIVSRFMKNVKKLGDINAMWYLTGMFTFLQGASSEEWKWYAPTEYMWTHGFCLKLQPGGNRLWRALDRGDNLALCLPQPTGDNGELLMDLATNQTLGPYSAFAEAQNRCIDNLAWWKRLFTSPTSEADWLHYQEDGTLSRESVSNEPKVLKYAEKDDVDISCKRSFRSHWYDATDRLIQILCNEALVESVDKMRKTGQSSGDQLLLEPYKYHLITGHPGPDFKSDADYSNYKGFIMCFDTRTPRDEDLRSTFTAVEPFLSDKRRTQRLCSNRPWVGKPPQVDVYRTVITVERGGKIFIKNYDHQGYIGNCLPVLREEMRAINLKNRRRPQHVNNVTPSNVTESSKVMSGKEIQAIVKDFKQAWNYAWIRLPSYFGDYKEQWNETADLEWIATRILRPYGTTVARPIELPPDGIMTYLPFVLSVVGTVGTAIGTGFAAKKVWTRCTTHPGRRYQAVRVRETTTV